MPADSALRRRPGAAPIAWILPLLGWVAAQVHAGARLDPAPAAETRYLAFLIAAVLLALALPGLLRPLQVGTASAAGLLAVWTLPAGPTRGAVVAAGLTLCLGWAALRLAGRQGSHDLASLLGLGIGGQVLFLSGLLLPELLGPRIVAGLLVPPAVAAAAIWVLGRERSPAIVLLVAGAAVLAGGGVTPAVAAGLLALSGGELFARAATLGAWRWVAWTALVPAFGVEPRFGLVAATGALLLALPASRRALAALPAAGLLVLPGAGWGDALAGLAWLALLLPGLAGALEARWREAMLAVVLGVAAVRLIDAPAALVVPSALLVIALATDRRGTSVQAVWTGALLVAAMLAATYPWVREEPVTAALGLLGVEPSWLAAGALWLAAALARGVAAAADRRRWAWRPRAPIAAGALLAFAAFLALPPAGSPLTEAPQLALTAERASWGASFDSQPVRGVRVVSALTHAADLPPGTVVADVGLLDETGEWVRLELRAGADTAEWAARRLEIRERPGFVAPEPWQVHLAERGRLLGARYRTDWRLDPPVRSGRIELHRRAELPEAVEVLLVRLEVVP